jgi:hypothetical protein
VLLILLLTIIILTIEIAIDFSSGMLGRVAVYHNDVEKEIKKVRVVPGVV